MLIMEPGRNGKRYSICSLFILHYIVYVQIDRLKPCSNFLTLDFDQIYFQSIQNKTKMSDKVCVPCFYCPVSLAKCLMILNTMTQWACSSQPLALCKTIMEGTQTNYSLMGTQVTPSNVQCSVHKTHAL